MSNPNDKFLYLFEEFLNKILLVCPNDRLNNYRKGFLALKIASPATPVNLFMAGCLDYKVHIKNRDENFFINSEQVKKSVTNFTDDFGINKHWNNFSDATKTAVWDYVQSLFVLGEVIINSKPKDFEKFSNLYSSDYKKEISNLQGENFSVEFISKINS